MMSSVNYNKHFTGSITGNHNNMLLYIYKFCKRCLEYCTCCDVTVHPCPASKPSIRSPGQFFHRGSDCSPGDRTKHSNYFLSYSARMVLPSHFLFPRFILSTLYYCYKSGNSNTWKKRPVIVAWRTGEQPTSTPVKRCHTPEFVSGENDPALQEQRGEHPEEETQAQGGEKAFKVDMFQPGI